MPRAAAAALVVFVILYVLVIADPPDEFGVGNWRTTNTGSALDDPSTFLTTVLDGLTFAGLLFIVASGFSLIFGLMRVVNMAHGAFYLLGGYIAYEIQQRMTGSGFGLNPSEVSTLEWVVPWLVAMVCIGVFGLARPAAAAALEPGAGPASGADHDRRLGDRRRPGHRALPAHRARRHAAVRRERGQHLVAGLDEPPRRPARRRGQLLARRGS